ncbi:MAG: M23 family metallopeptidase [Pseudomonadales bacterium]|nr:M23 family metallopeptidase [Gammaproteobacteria bacterium]MBK8308094.1 M23 family metallopeptidase [Gammaproteobacteria bacterium]
MMSGILDRLLLALLLCGPLPAVALELEGPLLQGGVVIGQVAPGTPVSLDGRALRVSEDGLFVIGFDRDSPQSHTLVAGAETRELAIKQREYAIQRVTGIAQNIMSPSAADLERIAREQRLVNAARGRDDPRSDFAAGFSWPILGPISGVYGSQRFYNGAPSRPHFGVDVAAPTGAPVHAPAPGIVTLAEPDLFYSGGTIIIDHGHELSSSFLHLSKVLVSVGQRVETGTLIAQVGATGRATGPHLDWRMNWRDARVDPQLLAGAMPAPPAAPAAQGDSN